MRIELSLALLVLPIASIAGEAGSLEQLLLDVASLISRVEALERDNDVLSRQAEFKQNGA